ncbi:MAG: sugar phosphate nucleotidyltransferase [Steroidobacteraceae bacterium]
MNDLQHTWAVVLAAGDGTRLSALTADSEGTSVPKQFCSLNGGQSLLQDALQRANRIVPRERVCAMVAGQHRPYWRPELYARPIANVIVQPRNRGTAHGVLLAALSILDRDPLARIMFLPADHYVADESALAQTLRETANLLSRNVHGLVLVGIEPDEPDPDLGYIVPGRRLADGSHAVRQFVEKPQQGLASELLTSGALWNSFIFAANGASLLGMLRQRIASSVEAMATAHAREDRWHALAELYQRLESIDFSRAITQGAERSLRVVAAPQCGWTDLGTPKRVADTLRRLGAAGSRPRPTEAPLASSIRPSAFIDLAAQHARLGLCI